MIYTTRLVECDYYSGVSNCPEASNNPNLDSIQTVINMLLKTYIISSMLAEAIFSILGNIDEIILEGRTMIKVGTEEYVKSSDFINGLENYVVEIHDHLPVEQSQVCVIITHR